MRRPAGNLDRHSWCIRSILGCAERSSAEALALFVGLLEHRREAAVARDEAVLEEPPAVLLHELVVLAALLDELRRGCHVGRIDARPDRIGRCRVAIHGDLEIREQHAERAWAARRAFRYLLVQVFDALLA